MQNTRIRPSPKKAALYLAGSFLGSLVAFALIYQSGIFKAGLWPAVQGMIANPPVFIIGLLLTGLLLSFPIYVLTALFVGIGGEGPCPVCWEKVRTIFGSETNLLCHNCDTYLESKKNVLQPMAPDATRDIPVFAAPTPWRDVRGVYAASQAGDAYEIATTKQEDARVLDAHWPDECCVCGAPAIRRDTIKAKLTLEPLQAVRMRTRIVEARADGAPHCAAHRGGVDFGAAPFATKPTDEAGFGLRFRSLRYRTLFRALNPWPWA